ncbi:hypothetical protein [Kitasatospora griseola]|uniref:hypothetical protein n=1 Tax=Kitasatospora griseola TaxID=2064 RepID=UPI00381C0883
MTRRTLLLPAEPDVLGPLYALEEALILQLRPLPDLGGEVWSPLPDYLVAEQVCGAYDRVLSALPAGTSAVIDGRVDLVPGVPVLVGAGGVELVQLLAVDVDGQDVISLSWLRDAVRTAAAGADETTGDLGVLLDDLASNWQGEWHRGEGTTGRAVADWVARALAPLVGASGSTPEDAADHALLLGLVRGAAGAERVVLTAEQEAAYGRYMLALIRATAPTAFSAHLSGWVAGVSAL